jgi:hypothetical protein
LSNHIDLLERRAYNLRGALFHAANIVVKQWT